MQGYVKKINGKLFIVWGKKWRLYKERNYLINSCINMLIQIKDICTHIYSH